MAVAKPFLTVGLLSEAKAPPYGRASYLDGVRYGSISIARVLGYIHAVKTIASHDSGHRARIGT